LKLESVEQKNSFEKQCGAALLRWIATRGKSAMFILLSLTVNKHDMPASPFVVPLCIRCLRETSIHVTSPLYTPVTRPPASDQYSNTSTCQSDEASKTPVAELDDRTVERSSRIHSLTPV